MIGEFRRYLPLLRMFAKESFYDERSTCELTIRGECPPGIEDGPLFSQDKGLFLAALLPLIFWQADATTGPRPARNEMDYLGSGFLA